MNIKTNKEEEFLSVVDVENKIIIFSCYTNLHFLSLVDLLYMDGTFQYCTKYFCQLFTIHGFKNNFYIPLVYCLLPNKHTTTYQKVFELIISKCVEFDLVIQPKRIVIDFELAIHNACIETWPTVTIIGCRFHLCQSWFKKIQQLGLVVEYKDKDSVIGKFLKLIFGIHFLNPDQVGDFFVNAIFGEMPDDERLKRFCDYLVETYIDEHSTFPPKVWASMTEEMCRTTNACESFHSAFNANFYYAHPNLYHFIDILKDFQISTYVKIRSTNKENKKIRSNTMKKQQYISDTIAKYKSGAISLLDFVTCLSYRYLPQ